MVVVQLRLRILSINIHWWLCTDMEDKWRCTIDFTDPWLGTIFVIFCLAIFRWFCEDMLVFVVLTKHCLRFYLQDEKIECCRFSRDGTKPFLFCTVQKGLPAHNFKDHIMPYFLFSSVTSVPFSDCGFPNNQVAER